MDTHVQALTDPEVDILVLSLMESRGKVGATKDEMMRVLDWATKTRTDQVLLELTLTGKLMVAIEDGELAFKARK